MTDTEVIQAFLNNDQKGIREVYLAWRVPFEKSLSRLLPNTDDMDDAYQEAFIRLQQHILTERLTANNIEKSLCAYFNTIGRYVALEMINQHNKGQQNAETQEEEIPHIIPLAHKTDQQDIDPDDEPAEVDVPFDPNEHMDTRERERVIRSLVDQLGAPCAPLLIGFFWNNQSMDQLAQELGYSSADSAKTQKSKCMKKVKSFVKQQLIEYGYGY